jgi:polar amino acid transport system substrate-binding protein
MRWITLTPVAVVTAMVLTGCGAQSSVSSATAGQSAAGTSAAGTSAAAAAAPTSAAPASTAAASTVATAAATTAAASAAAACAPAQLKTKKSGTLTVATDSPAYEPWFADNKPANGKGFESAVAYAVAHQLGYTAAQVSWVHASFDSVIAPTPKNYDFDINEVSITPARAKAVDFSSGYYDVAQAIIALKGDKYAKATTIAGLHGARLGAQQGTTSVDALKNQVKPGTSIRQYPTNDLAVQALKNGQIDGLAVDLPTGLYITAAELDNSTIIGQLPVTGSPEQFGLVLSKGSALTSCVTAATTALQAKGTFAQLQKHWLTTSAGAPVLQ